MIVYQTAEERQAARRASWRRNKDNQYRLYKSLLAEFGLPFADPGGTWTTHLSEIRHLRSMPPENLELWRLLWAEGKRYQCWWLERFTLAEIRRVASGIDSLTKEAA